MSTSATPFRSLVAIHAPNTHGFSRVHLPSAKDMKTYLSQCGNDCERKQHGVYSFVAEGQ
jgi:hypothetical protein